MFTIIDVVSHRRVISDQEIDHVGSMPSYPAQTEHICQPVMSYVLLLAN